MSRFYTCLALISVVLAGTACKERGAAEGLDAIEQRGTLRVAMTGQFPPFNYFDDNGKLVGFDVDVAERIASGLDVEADFVTLRWDGILAGLTAGRYDLIIASMAITEERQKAVDFSTPYYESGAQVFTLPNSPVAAEGSIEGATVGVNLGTTYEKALRERKDIKTIRTYNGVPELILDLSRGRIDAFVTDRLVGLHATTQTKVDLKAAGSPLYRERMGIPMRKGQPKLRAAIDRELQAMRKDGSYARISKKWFGRDITAP